MARDALQNRTLGRPSRCGRQRAEAALPRNRKRNRYRNERLCGPSGGPGVGCSKHSAWLGSGPCCSGGAAYWPTGSIGAKCSLRGLPTQAAAVAVDEMNDHVYISGQIAGGYEQGSVRFGSRRRCYVSYQPRKAANATQSCAIDGVA